MGTAILPVYLVLNGDSAPPAATARQDVAATTKGYKTAMRSLTKAFTDAESGGLTYTAVSADKTIATVGADAKTGAVTGKSLTITGVAAGETTITVNAFDGVNKQGVPATIDVTVVAKNTPPVVSVIRDIDDLIDSKKLRSDNALEVPFAALITPGVVGETEAVTFRVAIESLAADVTYLKPPTVVDGPVSGSYILTVQRSKAGMDDQSKSNEITIFAVDSFGAETMVDLNGIAGMASLVVGVNAPPRLARSLPSEVFLYRSANGGAAVGSLTDANNVLGLTGKPSNTWFSVTDFFAVEMKDSGPPIWPVWTTQPVPSAPLSQRVTPSCVGCHRTA